MLEFVDTVRKVPPARWGVLALLLAFALLALAEVTLSSHFALWVDELYSLWASDPTASLRESVRRVTGDSNPPLYFALLRLVRIVAPEPRAAIMLLNGLALLATSAFVLWTSRRTGERLLAALGLAAFALSGPTFFFIQEGRAYFMGNCLAFAIAWQAALAIAAPTSPPRPAVFIVLGTIAALTHLFAGLLAGSIAAGLLIGGLLGKRRELVLQGLALGLSTSIVTAIWLAATPAPVSNIGWIQFNREKLYEALWYVRFLAIGRQDMLLPLAVFLAYAVWLKQTRPLLVVFGVATFVFVALPIAVSLHTPMVTGRYWQIGAPMLIVLLIFLARDFSAPPPARAGRVLAAAIALYLGVTAIGGVRSARALLDVERGWGAWNGAPVVAELGRNCPPGSIRVDEFLSGYPIASGLPGALFVPAAGAPPLAARAAPCPVIGWAEHVRSPGFPQTASVEELLRVFNIQAAPDEVRVVRHFTGFVVLRADAPAKP